MKATLYLLTTEGLGDFYLVALSPNEAKERLETCLNKADYGFFDKRKITNIKILADEITDFPEGKKHFSGGSKLLFAHLGM